MDAKDVVFPPLLMLCESIARRPALLSMRACPAFNAKHHLLVLDASIRRSRPSSRHQLARNRNPLSRYAMSKLLDSILSHTCTMSFHSCYFTKLFHAFIL